MNQSYGLTIIKFIAMAFLWVSCGEPTFIQFSKIEGEGNGDLSHVIVNDLNWTESNDPRVALLLISKSSLFMGRCTGFLIGEKWIMTNNHCVKSEKEAKGVKAIFGYDSNSSLPSNLNKRSTIFCDKLVATNTELDFSILECRDKPGQFFGWVSLEEKSPVAGTELFIVHQNCDYFTSENCFPTKKKSPGKILDSSLFGEKLETSYRFFHDADILQGSSGAPIYDKRSKKVLGLLNVEYRSGEDKNDGRGPMNGAIKMSSILEYLKEQKPILYDKIQSERREKPSYSEEDILIKGSYSYPDFGNNYIFTLKVKLREEKSDDILKIQYSFFQEGELKIVSSKNTRSSFKKVFSVPDPIFMGSVDVFLKGGNKITKRFRFKAKKKFPGPGPEDFDINKVSVDYDVVYDKFMDRFIFSINLLGERKNLQKINKVTYSLSSFSNINISKFEVPFKSRLVSTKIKHNLNLSLELKNGQFEKKNIECYVPDTIVRFREKHKRSYSRNPFSIGVKIKKDRELFYFFGRPIFKFMVYLNGSNKFIEKVKRVDYFFKDDWENKERKVTSFNKRLKFSTPVFRTLNRNLEIYKTKITFKNGVEKYLKGVNLSDFRN